MTSSISLSQCIQIIDKISNANIRKINFAGGEPTLSPYLGKLLNYSKKLGLITSIISNGTGINKVFLQKNKRYIDWIGLSIDSRIESTNYKLGRGNGNLVKQIIQKSRLIHNLGIKLKINTVANKLNYQEDLSRLIKTLNPKRWKIFQVLEIKNHNSKNFDNLSISKPQFERFVKRHETLKPITETNQLMLESYLMVDPHGRFYQNTENAYIFSRPILKVGMKNALSDISFDPRKFVKRGGIYAW